jgi:hypothetical protein
MASRSGRSRAVSGAAGEVVGTRSFGFFCIVWQKKLALQAKRGRNAFHSRSEFNQAPLTFIPQSGKQSSRDSRFEKAKRP